MYKLKSLSVLMIALFVVAIALIPGTVTAIPVDLELALLVDVSGSVDATDFSLQKNGYVQAFQSASIINAITLGGTYHSIAATLVYWSDSAVQSVGWTLINDAASANAFANDIDAVIRPFSGQTGMTNAVNFGAGLFINEFQGTRSVIDLSGDGSESVVCNSSEPNCWPLQDARDNALANGVTTINALFIQDRDFFGVNPGDLINAIDYANDNLIGGPNAFVMVAANFEDFGAAIVSKLEREITPVPEPSVLILFGTGLVAFGALRSFRKK
jgi:hypothetical protein